jgi:hypothetical protein
MPKILDLAARRNWKQALLFYVIYLLVLLFGCALPGVLAAVIASPYMPEQNFLNQTAKIIGHTAAFIACTILAALIIRAKRAKDFRILLPFVGTVILAYAGGAVLGMILPAYMTTRVKKK